MPQLTQLGEVIWSQLFWLVVTMALVYFGIAKGMVPKIMSTMDARDDRISADLAAAEGARQAADATEEAYRARINDSRAEALKVTAGAKAESARASEGRIAAADAEIREKIDAAEARLRERAGAAAGEIETVASEAAREMVGRLAGLKISAADAAKAVKAVANG
jgi:F-type H+-transporting ATPase subunit b